MIANYIFDKTTFFRNRVKKLSDIEKKRKYEIFLLYRYT